MKTKINLVLRGTVLFVITQAVGILAALRFKGYLEYQHIIFPQIYWWHFLIFFGIATLLIVKFPQIIKLFDRFPRRTLKKKILPRKTNLKIKEKIKIRFWWRIGFAVLISLAGFVVLGLFFSQPYSIILAVILGISWLLISRVFYHNFSMMLLLIAFGMIFGFGFSWLDALIILGILAVYDFLAVYRFKFMVGLSKMMVKNETFLGFIIPKLKISDFKAKLEEAASDFEIDLSKNRPERFSLMGGGDVALPLVLTVSVLVSFGLGSALIVAGFSIIGVIAVYLFFFYKKNYPMPALPLIVGFAALGLLISFII